MNQFLLILGDVASPKFLVSVWKPVVLLLPFVGWAWVITRVYDKHAARFFLAREKWNAIHLSAGLAAFLAAVLMPIEGEAAFWVGLLLAIAILVADLVAYPMVANKDERVPEAHRIRLNALGEMAKARAERQQARQVAQVELKITSADKTLLPPPQKDTPEYETRVAAEQLVLKGLGSRASQVDLAPTGKDGAYAMSYLVDGVRPNQPEAVPAAVAVKVIDLWKSAAKLDVNDRRRRLSGDAIAERGEAKTRLRIQTLGTAAGQRMTMLFDPEKQVRRKPEDLGLLEPQMAALKSIAEEGKGVVLLAAGPDQGRTTTLYSALRLHDAYTSNIQTVELEPQDSLEGVRQNAWESTGDGPEYATFLRSILRRDPQVVGVAEVPDDATAREAAKADLERTRIYLSLKADTAVAALQSYVKSVGDADLAAKGLRGVVVQKLVRKLCTNCRTPYQPTPEILKALGAPAGKVPQLFKKGGQVLIKNKPEVCPVCQGVGYVGQEGVFEVWPIDAGVRELIKSGNWQGVQAELRKKQLPSLRQSLAAKVVAGTTSVEEYGRATSEPKAPAAAPAKPAAAAGAKPSAPAAAASKPPAKK